MLVCQGALRPQSDDVDLEVLEGQALGQPRVTRGDERFATELLEDHSEEHPADANEGGDVQEVERRVLPTLVVREHGLNNVEHVYPVHEQQPAGTQEERLSDSLHGA